MKKELYEICDRNQKIDEGVVLLFLKNNLTAYSTECFLHSYYLKIKEALKNINNVTVAFAFTLKSIGALDYGTVYLEIPKNIQESYIKPSCTNKVTCH